jgi:hypothetical protein
MTVVSGKVRLKVSPEVARILTPGAPRDLQLMAARGALPLAGRDLVTVLFFLLHGRDPQLRSQAQTTVQELPSPLLAGVMGDADWPPQLLDYLARARPEDPTLLEVLLPHPGLPEAALLALAERSTAAVELLAHNQRLLERTPGLAAALCRNPATDRATRFRLGWQDPDAHLDPESGNPGPAEQEPAQQPDPGVETGEVEADSESEEAEAEEELNQSKYQQSLEMGVSEKIKMALTGDKEWRTIFTKDPNKLVSSAVLKNPRITEGEVLAIAKNKSSSEELIRLITLNREWLKNYAIKKALIFHPRTPLQQGLRYLAILGEKDMKTLAKSRGVSQVIVNAARRAVLTKDKKK